MTVQELMYDAVMNEPLDKFKKVFRNIIATASLIELKALKKSLFETEITSPASDLEELGTAEKIALASIILEEAINKGQIKQSDIDLLKQNAKADINWKSLIKDGMMLKNLASMVKDHARSFNDFAISWNNLMKAILSKNASTIMHQIGKGFHWAWLENFQIAAIEKYEDSSIWSRIEEKLGEKAGKTSLRKIREELQENFNIRAIEVIKEIQQKYPKLSSESIYNYIKYKISILSNSIILKNENPVMKQEWKDLDKELGFYINKLLKDMHDYGVSRLAAETLSNKDKLWDFIIHIMEDAIATSKSTSVSSIIAQITWNGCKPGKNEIAAMLTGYDSRIDAGLGKINADYNFSRNTMQDLVNFAFRSFIDKKNKIGNAQYRQAFVRFGLPMKKLIGEMKAYVDANLNPYEMDHALDSLAMIHDVWKAATSVLERANETGDYTYKNLEVDLTSTFADRIRDLAEQMKTYGNITDNDIYNTFARYLKKARTRLLANYKDIMWENPFEKEFSNQINSLLRDMIDFSMDHIGSSNASARMDMWDIIIRIVNSTLVGMKRTISAKQNASMLIDEYSKFYREKVEEVLLLMIDGIRQAMIDKSLNLENIDIYGRIDMNALEINCANALTLYFNEKYPAFGEIMPSKMTNETAKQYFTDLDKILEPFLDKIKSSDLSNADKVRVLKAILEESEQFMFVTIFDIYAHQRK